MIKAVIFDIDDTFSLTEATSFDIENTILQRMGRLPMSRKIHLETWELPISKALPRRSPGTDIEAFKAYYQTMIEEFSRSGKLDNVPEENYTALDKLTELGMLLIVLTSRSHDRISHMLRPNHPLANRVSSFYYRDNLKYRKPDPRVFDKLLADNTLLATQCVYVGDAIKDCCAAKEAGLYFIANLESRLRKKDDFTGLSVDIFINTFPEVVCAVQTLNDPTSAQ